MRTGYPNAILLGCMHHFKVLFTLFWLLKAVFYDTKTAPTLKS